MSSEHIFSSVWDALADDAQEAAHLKVRSALMIELNQCICSWPGSDIDKASRLGISPASFSNLKSGRIDLFNLDALVDLAAAAGLAVSIQLTAA